MYGMNFSGGDNRTHGSIERAARIDSFQAGKVERVGTVLVTCGDRLYPLTCEHREGPGEAVRLTVRGERWAVVLELARVRSGFGGTRAYWVCPGCGKRARYLYLKGDRFLCRRCAMLNYQTQQRTRDSFNHFRDGLKLARDKLHWTPGYVTPEDFPCLTPPCHRYMHQSTYLRYLARFRRYQEAYERDNLREMLAILRR